MLLTVAIGGVSVACYGEVHAPPSPATSRVPIIVGQVLSIGPDDVTYRLTGDRLVTLGVPAPGATPSVLLLSDTRVARPASAGTGGLLLYGEDAAGAFWAGTDAPDADGCFRLRGQGFIEPGKIHLSSGLVLDLTADGKPWLNGRAANQAGPTWILAFDIVCLDRDGHVTFINQLPLGV
jgi:hypothetical protein